MRSCYWMQAALSPVLPELLAVVRVYGGSSVGGIMCLIAIMIFDRLARDDTLFLQYEVCFFLRPGRALHLMCSVSRGSTVERHQRDLLQGNVLATVSCILSALELSRDFSLAVDLGLGVLSRIAFTRDSQVGVWGPGAVHCTFVLHLLTVSQLDVRSFFGA